MHWFDAIGHATWWIYHHPNVQDQAYIPSTFVLIQQMPKEVANNCWSLWNKCLQTRQMTDFINFQHSVHDWWAEIAAQPCSVIRQYRLENDQLVDTQE